MKPKCFGTGATWPPLNYGANGCDECPVFWECTEKCGTKAYYIAAIQLRDSNADIFKEIIKK